MNDPMNEFMLRHYQMLADSYMELAQEYVDEALTTVDKSPARSLQIATVALMLKAQAEVAARMYKKLLP